MPEKGAPPNVHPVQRRVLKALGSLSSPLLPDDYLEMVNPLWSTRELRGRIEEVKHEAGKVSPYLVKEAKPGTIVSLSNIEGEFVLSDPPPDKLLFISAGSGVTPI